MKVMLREATDNDMELVLAWRNNPLVWKGLYGQSTENRPLTWKEHLAWWDSHKHWKKFIIQVDNKDVGWLYISLLDYWSPEIGLGIGEISYWGKGVGRTALILAHDSIRGEGYRFTHTTILNSNVRSIKLFQSVGYNSGPESRPGEKWYFKNLL